MRFEFAKYTDVTKYAKEVSADDYYDYYADCERVLICPDTHDAWVAKIQVGYNAEYEPEEDKVILERNKINGMGARHENIHHPNYANKILTLDYEDGSNWDVNEYDSIDEALDDLDGGFGIIPEGDEE